VLRLASYVLKILEETWFAGKYHQKLPTPLTAQTFQDVQMIFSACDVLWSRQLQSRRTSVRKTLGPLAFMPLVAGR
jgi:hypothetical protein